SIAVKAHSFCGCQLCSNVVVFQKDFIIPWLSDFVLAVEARAITRIRILKRPGSGLKITRHGREKESSDLKLTQVGKSFDTVMPGIIANGIPSVNIAVTSVRRRTQFGHSKGNGC